MTTANPRNVGNVKRTPATAVEISKIQGFLDKLNEEKSSISIDPTANILVTGRPNSGIEDFKNLVVAHFDEIGVDYVILKVEDANSSIVAANAVKTPGKVVIIEDEYRLLFSAGLKLSLVKNVIYITKHWNLGMVESAMFQHHLAFAAFRNDDLTDYPYPFSAVGSDLNRGDYILIGNRAISDLDNTSLVEG